MLEREASCKYLTICTPVFWGDGSGAASYYQLLTKECLALGWIVSVIGDQEAATHDLNLNYFPLFPVRCLRDRQFLRDRLAYLRQNLAYLKIGNILSKRSSQSTLIHSSFYNHPGLFPQVMKRVMQRNPNINFIADVRDALMPVRAVPVLNDYRHVIACSENVAAHLCENGVEPDRIVKIPVIQERLQVNDDLSASVLVELGIDGRAYIFFGGLIKEEKAVDILLEAYLQYVRPARRGMLLVVAGLMKTSNGRIREMLAQEGVLYVGNRSRDEVLALMSGAALCVNLSPNEGMPRSCLEALALGRPVALPPNVPEFARYCGDFVVADRSPSAVAARLLEIMDAGVTVGYPIERHYPEAVLPIYKQLLVD